LDPMARKPPKKIAGSDPNEPRVYGRNLPSDPRLAGLLVCSHATSRGKLMRRDLVMVPDGHLEIFLDFRAVAGKKIPMLVGIRPNAIRLKTGRPLDIMGIKFMPGMFYSLFRASTAAFSKDFIPLSSVIGKAALPFNGVFKERTPAARMRLLNAILADCAGKREPMSRELSAALESMYARKGRITVGEMARTAGWTRRWFLETFKKWIGTSPRAFSKNLKFVIAVRELNAGNRPVAAAHEAGYADQPHLNRAFKSQMGLTPGETFKYKRHRKILPLEP